MIRVLVVDDSATARALVREILVSDPELHVVGEARDGLEAVELTQKLRPDLVAMDVHMPRMDGLAATKEIMITAPTPIILITASREGREIELTMHALRAGALVALDKPPGPSSPAFKGATQNLIATVKAMAQVKVVRHWRPQPSLKGLSRWQYGAKRRVALVAIATSTGGPAALHRLLSELPGDFPAPIAVVQHITAGFTAGLASWLNNASALRVKIAEQGESLAPHTVYLAPDGWHLGASSRATATISQEAPVGGFRPSGTFLFESAAKAFGPEALAVILTGMGQDGLEGLRSIRQAGGQVIAQDEASSVVFGMPGAAIAAGLADQVVPLDAIASRLIEIIQV